MKILESATKAQPNQHKSATEPAQHTAHPAENKAILHAENLTLQRAEEILNALQSVGINPASSQPHTSLNLPAKELKTIYYKFSQRSKVAASTVYKYFLYFAAKCESEKYFYERIKQAFPNLSAAELLAAAASHGIKPSRTGIAINPRNFDGTPFLDESQHTLQIIRNTPLLTNRISFWNKKTGKYETSPKYLTPSKEKTGVDGVPPQPNNVVLENLKNSVKGGTLFLTEGYFKALFLSLCGVPCVAFNGIQMFNLTDEIKDYLTELEVKNICILFDNDATNLGSAKDTNRTDNGRINDFCNAVTRIAAQIFKDAELKKVKVFYCEVNKTDATKDEKGEYLKAFDDLIIHDRTKQNELTTALESLKTSDFFKFLRLHKSNYIENLQTWFSIDSYRTFYNKYIKPQGKSEFTFNNVDYFYKDNVPYLSKHPFLVTYDSQKLTVNQYVDEVTPAIASTVKTAQITAVSAPPASGKTTACLALGKELKRKIIICVPLRSIASQQAYELKKKANEAQKQKIDFALMENGTITNRYGTKITAAEASKKEAIICTFDAVKKIKDLQNKILIIDEVHELVDAYGYRAAVLLDIYTLLKSSYKTVLLSGTMPTHLVKLLGASLIEITPKTLINKVFEIHENAKRELTPTFLQLLKDSDRSKGITVTYLNNSDVLEDIKEIAIENGMYQPPAISILSRKVIDSKGSEVYDNLLTANELQNVELVLATSIIKQGVNIKNKEYQPKNLFDTLEKGIKTLPISNIYTVGVNDSNELLQLAARFREMKTINVSTLLHKERNINHLVFCHDTESYAAEQIETAKRFAAIENSKPANTQNVNGFSHPLNDNIFFNAVSDCWDVDILKILYKEKQRKITYGNNAALFTELAAAQNTTVVFANDTTEPTTASKPASELVTDVKQKLKQSATDRANNRKKCRSDFFDLVENGLQYLVIDNLYLNAKEYRNTEMVKALATYYYKPQGIAEPTDRTSELTEFYELQKEAFAGGYFTKIAKYFVRLKFWQCDDILTVLRNNTDNDLKLMCERFNAVSKGKTPQKAGAKLLQKLFLEKYGKQTVLSFREFERFVRSCFNNENLNFTPSELRHLFERHFYAAKITKFSFINFAPITATPQKDGLKITIGNDAYLLRSAIYCEF